MTDPSPSSQFLEFASVQSRSSLPHLDARDPNEVIHQKATDNANRIRLKKTRQKQTPRLEQPFPTLLTSSLPITSEPVGELKTEIKNLEVSAQVLSGSLPDLWRSKATTLVPIHEAEGDSGRHRKDELLELDSQTRTVELTIPEDDSNLGMQQSSKKGASGKISFGNFHEALKASPSTTFDNRNQLHGRIYLWRDALTIEFRPAEEAGLSGLATRPWPGVGSAEGPGPDEAQQSIKEENNLIQEYISLNSHSAAYEPSTEEKSPRLPLTKTALLVSGAHHTANEPSNNLLLMIRQQRMKLCRGLKITVHIGNTGFRSIPKDAAIVVSPTIRDYFIRHPESQNFYFEQAVDPTAVRLLLVKWMQRVCVVFEAFEVPLQDTLAANIAVIEAARILRMHRYVSYIDKMYSAYFGYQLPLYDDIVLVEKGTTDDSSLWQCMISNLCYHRRNKHIPDPKVFATFLEAHPRIANAMASAEPSPFATWKQLYSIRARRQKKWQRWQRLEAELNEWKAQNPTGRPR
ncbi:hypothetical protein T440DRAFT_518643 [Plenodomus tracheiphilus IPT5]|uniref:Uncharacterized protein n=1 Tax=Plenodomus tracheiphilus IPT5 TaxID=1408161 RepID=A0A6A7B7A2_9PLEO|nr:hypothetical protein T440DRAFT_518643 [Plenodomus tracheiphilus IPT5]